jgi:hypothetical protein
MSIEPPEPPKPQAPAPRDVPWDQLREFVRVATEIGINDVSELTEIFNAASNEELRAKMVENIQLITEPLEKWRALMKQFLALVDGRSTIAAEQYQVEIILLERIQKLGKEAETGEEVLELAAAYAQLREASIAPGRYMPDIRHTDKPTGE